MAIFSPAGRPVREPKDDTSPERGDAAAGMRRRKIKIGKSLATVLLPPNAQDAFHLGYLLYYRVELAPVPDLEEESYPGLLVLKRICLYVAYVYVHGGDS